MRQTYETKQNLKTCFVKWFINKHNMYNFGFHCYLNTKLILNEWHEGFVVCMKSLFSKMWEVHKRDS